MKMSRGLRNNNPGNIRLGSFKYKGERAKSSDVAFRQFESMEWGYRAMFVLLHTYALRYDCRTLRDIISRYAPSSENNTEAYIRRVAGMTHLANDEQLDTLDRRVMVDVVSAMSAVENGREADLASVVAGWELFCADFARK